jgi:beta-lactam-binding protein with PASTA domain
MKALAKNQLNRYQSAGEMRTDLQRALADQPVAAEAVMSDAERTQFIARTPAPPVAVRRQDDVPGEPEDDHRSGLIWLAIVVALLLVIGAAVAAIFFIGNDKGTPKVAVPSIIGQLPAAGEEALRTAKLVPLKGEDTHDTCDGGAKVDEGKICIVEPAPGVKIKEGSTVTYHLYTPETVQVPDVTGKQYNDAANTLNGLGLKAKKKPVDDPAAAGTVVDQDPPAFKDVAPGTTVTLSVSNGKVKLPDVRGKKLEDALQILNTAQYTNVDHSQTAITTDQTKDGTVAGEDPRWDISYPLTQKVTLTIFKYVKPVPTCTTPTITSPAPTDTGVPTTSATGLPPCTT